MFEFLTTSLYILNLFLLFLLQVRVLEVDLATQIDDYQRSIKEHKHKANHWASKLVTLRETAAQNAGLLTEVYMDIDR